MVEKIEKGKGSKRKLKKAKGKKGKEKKGKGKKDGNEAFCHVLS